LWDLVDPVGFRASCRGFRDGWEGIAGELEAFCVGEVWRQGHVGDDPATCVLSCGVWRVSQAGPSGTLVFFDSLSRNQPICRAETGAKRERQSRFWCVSPSTWLLVTSAPCSGESGCHCSSACRTCRAHERPVSGQSDCNIGTPRVDFGCPAEYTGFRWQIAWSRLIISIRIGSGC
jgi:hypothetical protein